MTTNFAYIAHTISVRAIGVTPLSYDTWVRIAMRCISQNCAEYEAKQNRTVSVRSINQK